VAIEFGGDLKRPLMPLSVPALPNGRVPVAACGAAFTYAHIAGQACPIHLALAERSLRGQVAKDTLRDERGADELSRAKDGSMGFPGTSGGPI
jgi:hypothetical protein